MPAPTQVRTFDDTEELETVNLHNVTSSMRLMAAMVFSSGNDNAFHFVKV